MRGRRRFAAAAAVGLTLAALAACGDDTPESTQEIQEYSGVGDCLKPDPDRPGGFLQAECGDEEATVEIVEMVFGTDLEPPVCPPGTDLLVESEQGPVVDGEIDGLPQTWCLRNLAPPHPGDPGMGGGELVVRDCFAVGQDGSVEEAACDGSGGAVPQHRLLAIATTPESCPRATAEHIELSSFPVQVLCAGPV